MTKPKGNNKHYAQSSIYALLRSGYCVYLFAPKSNWYDLEDNDGNKLKIINYSIVTEETDESFVLFEDIN